MQSLVIFAGAFVGGFVLTSLISIVAPRLGLVDHPGGRKEHAHPTPLVGGIAIALSLVVGLVSASHVVALPLAVAVVVLMAVGIADDIHEVSPLPKFAVQALACLIMIFWAGVKLHTVGDITGFRPIGLSWFVIPVTVFAVIGVVNAINMADGIDGHASGIGLVAFIAFAFVARESGLWDQYKILLALVGGTAGFWMLNARWPWNTKARSFLGDAGSMLLGFLIGWFAIELTEGNGSPNTGTRTFPPICALWVIVIPLCDCVSLMLRRRKAGRSMFVADRQHLHHYLLNRGLSVGRASAVSVALCALCAAFGIVGWKLDLPEWFMFWSFVAFFVVYHRHMSRSFRVMPTHSAFAPASVEAPKARL